MSGTTLELRRVSKTFPGGIRALDNVSLTVRPGEFVVIVGASGAGKSTLLRTINGLVRPDSGQVLVGGRDISALRGKELRRLRRGIGLIFQDFNLVERAAVLTNVLTGRLGYLPAWQTVLGIFPPADVAMARQALDRLGLADKTFAKAAELSGGQKQRVSIARALVQQPHTILADEPVASLDPPTARDILGWFRRINEQEGITVIVNLHDIGLAAEFGGRLVGMREGKIVHDGPASQVDKQTFARIYRRSLEEIGHAAD
ncbi:MAG TPA: phosphonate ABC transporter ATP-binding protein [Bacillota bacterium]|nr:phosphonate ABC transporter ATP-binding protein [Bacillota bacterium]HPZ89917.1 phosphonate ABC transporter ATP-binding protein [Bacillota bacterium]